jgi:Mrp family chromosome partitioning ATPase
MQDRLIRRVLRVVALAAVASAIGVPAAQARPAPDELGGTVGLVSSPVNRFADQMKVYARWEAQQVALAYLRSQSRPVYGIGDNMSVYSAQAKTKHATLAKQLSKPVYGIGDNMSVYSAQAKAKHATKHTKATRPDDRAGVRGI